MRRLAAPVASAILLSTSSAWSDPDATARRAVRVLAPACAVRPVDLAQYTAVLRVELEAAGFTLRDPEAARDSPALTLVLEATPCEPRATAVDVVVVNPASGQREHRLVPVWDLDVSARPRAVALASAELLVRVAWHDPDAPATAPPVGAAPAAAPDTTPSTRRDGAPRDETPSPSSSSTHPVAPREVERAAPDTARPGHLPAKTLGAAFEYRSYPVLHTAMLGGRIAGRFRLGDAGLELGVDAGASAGSVADALGTIRVTSGTAGLSLAHVSGGRDVLAAVGPSLEVGYGSVSGDPAPGVRGGSQGSFLAAMSLDAGLRVRSGSDWWLGADALGGWSLSALRGLADDRPVAGTSGVMAALRLGLARAW